MLIRAIRGENFMKFRTINLADIPTTGLVGIGGLNEGGKSTVGELLQFALFGKTISTSDSSVTDLIHWDADHCVVEVDFTFAAARDGSDENFRIWREIDRYGTNFARLVRLDDRREVASGTLQVQEELRRRLKFGFSDFLRSFYLAEKDVPRSPSELKDFLDRIVGLDILQDCEREVRQEVVEFEEEFGRRQGEIQRNLQQIEKYGPNIEKIPEVEKTRDAHDARLAELKEEERQQSEEAKQITDLVKERESQRDRLRSLKSRTATTLGGAVQNALRAYSGGGPEALAASRKDLESNRGRLQQLSEITDEVTRLQTQVDTASREITARLEGDGEDSFPTLQRSLEEKRTAAERSRGGVRVLAVFLLVLGLICGASAAVEQYRPFLTDGMDETQAAAVVIGLAAAAVFALILAMMAAVKSRGHRNRRDEVSREMEGLEENRGEVAEDLDLLEGFDAESLAVERVAETLSATRVTAVKERLDAFEGTRKRVLGESGELGPWCQETAENEHRIVQRLRSRSKELTKSREKITESQRQEQSKRDRTDSEAREYHKQEGRRAALEEQNAELEKAAGELRERLEVRQLLIQLLSETIESTRHRAGPSLGKSLRKLLPHITGGRYSDVQITSDFQLRLFTSEKSDFMVAHELSGGTFEGLSLGFRLAYSQAFIRAVTRAPQFLFLDEPFKSMDRSRVTRMLSVLPRLSPELSQVFVVMPGIPEGERECFDVIVEARVGEGELSSALGGAPIRKNPAPGPNTGNETPPVADADAGSGNNDEGPGAHVMYPKGFEGREFEDRAWLKTPGATPGEEEPDTPPEK